MRDLYKCSDISFHSLWNDATSWSWSELGEPSFRSSYTKGKDWKICCQFNLRYFYVGLSTLISTPYIAWLYEGVLIFSVMYIIYLLICVSRANVLLRQHQPGVGKFKWGYTYCVWVFRLFASQHKWPTGLRTCFMWNSYVTIRLLLYARNSDEKRTQNI